MYCETSFSLSFPFLFALFPFKVASTRITDSVWSLSRLQVGRLWVNNDDVWAVISSISHVAAGLKCGDSTCSFVTRRRRRRRRRRLPLHKCLETNVRKCPESRLTSPRRINLYPGSLGGVRPPSARSCWAFSPLRRSGRRKHPATEPTTSTSSWTSKTRTPTREEMSFHVSRNAGWSLVNTTGYLNNTGCHVNRPPERLWRA